MKYVPGTTFETGRRLATGLLVSLSALVASAVPPSITTQPVSAVVGVGQAASVSVGNSGTPPFGYRWLKDGVILAGQTGSTLSFAAFQFTNSGSYSVVITNADGLAVSYPAALSVSNAPLRVWGRNNYGQLGNGTTNDSGAFVAAASNVIAAAGGQYHSLFVKADGILWTMGWNSLGQLGNGTKASTNLPVAVTTGVVAMAGGYQHSLFVKTNGTLWGMGDNQFGQLGSITWASTNRPFAIASNVAAAAAGDSHSLFVKADGTLWAMGYNHSGQLGLGVTFDYDGSLPLVVTSNVMAVAAGHYHSLFVKADGTLWAMGDNDYGQLGIGTLIDTNRPTLVASNVVGAAGGQYHSLFMKADGTLWAMGRNNYGQLGIGTLTDTNRPTLVASNVVALACGGSHSLFVKADGTFWTMGYNYYGQLGNGTTNNGNVPAQVGGGGWLPASLAKGPSFYHSLAIAGALPVLAVMSNQTVTVGESASFTAVVSAGDGPFAYQWQCNGTNIVGATNGTFTLPIATLSDAGNYLVIVTGPFGGTASASAGLTVNKAPFTLMIESSHGTANPVPGPHAYVDGTVLTNTATGPDTQGPTRFVCAGWIMVGNEPASGAATQCVVTVTNNATLTWLWTTNYWLVTTAGTHGAVNVGTGWQPMGEPTQITAMASRYYHFTNWSGDVPGGSVYVNPLNLLMDGPKAVQAAFAQNLATNGVPEEWLAAYGWTNAFDEAAMADHDRDGHAAWQEYAAGTDPTNGTSVLSVTDWSPAFGTNFVETVETNELEEVSTQRVYEVLGLRLAWSSVTGRVYDVRWVPRVPPDAALQGFPNGTNLPATPPVNVHTMLWADLPVTQATFRINVRQP